MCSKKSLYDTFKVRVLEKLSQYSPFLIFKPSSFSFNSAFITGKTEVGYYTYFGIVKRLG